MQNVEIFEGKRATSYDQAIKLWHPGYEWLHPFIPLILTRYLDTHSEKHILVAGCGTGTEMEKVLKLSPVWKVTGIDPSPDMVTQAKEKLASGSHTHSYSLVNGYVDDLPLHQKWDAATLILVMHFLPDNGKKLHLLESISQRMKPGAPLILADVFGTPDTVAYHLSLLKVWLIEKGISAKIVEQGIEHIQHDISYIPEERLLFLLSKAGFGNIHQFMQTLVYGGWICEKV